VLEDLLWLQLGNVDHHGMFKYDKQTGLRLDVNWYLTIGSEVD